MKLVLTLLCRNEADIIASNIDFHLSRGVDLIIATDNGSTDGTTAILEHYQSKGVLQLLHEASHTHDQEVWVTRMARMAASEHGADWVINSDADEFWWPRDAAFKEVLAAVPSEIQALQVHRTNFLPPAANAPSSLPFHQIQIIRESHSFNSLGHPLPPKVCHRGEAEIVVSDGNHAVQRNGIQVKTLQNTSIEILHFPIRSFGQLERKIREGAEALERNTRISPSVGDSWRNLYKNHLLTGQLLDYFARLRPDSQELSRALSQGDLIEDLRLQQALKNLVTLNPDSIEANSL